MKKIIKKILEDKDYYNNTREEDMKLIIKEFIKRIQEEIDILAEIKLLSPFYINLMIDKVFKEEFEEELLK